VGGLLGEPGILPDFLPAAQVFDARGVRSPDRVDRELDQCRAGEIIALRAALKLSGAGALGYPAVAVVPLTRARSAGAAAAVANLVYVVHADAAVQPAGRGQQNRTLFRHLFPSRCSGSFFRERFGGRGSGDRQNGRSGSFQKISSIHRLFDLSGG